MASDTQAPKIFISYRRYDSSGETMLIYEFLQRKFEPQCLFMDVAAIPAGVDFRKYLHDAVRACDVVLVVIGRDWLNAENEKGERRLDDPRDFVRIEIEAALEREIRVIPVLVRDAAILRPEQLPESIQELAYRNALEVRPGRSTRSDIERLIRELEAAPPSPESASHSEPALSSERKGSSVHPEPPDSESPPPRAGNVVANSIGMKLTLIPAGEFLMGSPDSDPHARDWEKPQHRVRITKPFHLGVYPVTQEDYEQVMCENPSHFEGNPRLPVEKVSWFDAINFCNRLSERERLAQYYRIDGHAIEILGGNGYRLPTEAEWEYACRAGTTTRWSCGDDQNTLQRFAWLKANSQEKTQPVGEKEPNGSGLFDMHGNVWEWCWDWYEEYSAEQLTDPGGPSQAALRVIRGGSWRYDAEVCRAASRSRLGPRHRLNYLGFRVAAGPPSKSSQEHADK